MGERNELREKLLAQHNELRTTLQGVRKLTEKLKRRGKGTPVGDELRATLRGLRERAQAHVVFENQVLRPVLAELDAWGPERAKQMEQEHRQEHAALLQGIAEAENAATMKELVRIATKTADELLAHIEEEERLFLNAKILNDDIVVGDYFGG